MADDGKVLPFLPPPTKKKPAKPKAPVVSNEVQRAADAIDKGKELQDKVAAMDPPTRAAAAVNLRIEGASWSEIARVLDYSSPQRARVAVERALAEMAESEEDKEQLRWTMNQRLNRLLYSLMRRGTNPHDQDHLAYVSKVLAVMDRQAKLNGLDMPTTIAVYNPSNDAIEKYVEQTVAILRSANGEIEADIMAEEDIEDAEVVEDGPEGRETPGMGGPEPSGVAGEGEGEDGEEG